MRQTNREQIADIVRMLGGTPKGKTLSDVMDELEAVIELGGSSSTPVQTGGLDDGDNNEVFDEGGNSGGSGTNTVADPEGSSHTQDPNDGNVGGE